MIGRRSRTHWRLGHAAQWRGKFHTRLVSERLILENEHIRQCSLLPWATFLHPPPGPERGATASRDPVTRRIAASPTRDFWGNRSSQATKHLASRVVLRSKMGNEWITTKQVRLAIFSYFPKSDGSENFSLRKGAIPNAPIITGRERGFQTRRRARHTDLPYLLSTPWRASCLPGTHQGTPPAGKGGKLFKFCCWASELAHHRGMDVPFLGSSLWSRNQHALVLIPFLCIGNDYIVYWLLCSSSHRHLFTLPSTQRQQQSWLRLPPAPESLLAGRFL